MSTITAQDTETGKTVTFDWSGDGQPTDADLEEVFKAAKDFAPAVTVPVPPVKPTFSSRIKSFLSDLTPGPAETPLSILGLPAPKPEEKQDPVSAAERLKLGDDALAEYIAGIKGVKPDAVTQQDIEEQRIADRKAAPTAQAVEQKPIPASADLLSAPQAPAPIAPVAAPDVTAVAPPTPAEQPDVFDQAAAPPAAPQDLTNVDVRPPESTQQQPVLQYDPGLVELLGNTGKQFAHGATAGMVGHTEQGEQGLAGPFAEIAGNLVGAGVSEAVAPLIGPAVFGAISDVKSQIENEGLDLKDVSAVRAAVNGAFTAALFKVPMVLGRDALTKAVTGAGVGTGFSVANVMADQLVKQGKIDFTDPEWSEQYKQAIKYGIPIGLAAAAGSHAKVPDLVVKAHEEAVGPKVEPAVPPEVPKVETSVAKPVAEAPPEVPIEPPAPPVPTSSRNLTASLPRELSGAKSRYNIGQDSYLPQFESDIDKALYITSQKTKSRADQKYRDYLTDQVGLTDAEIDEIGPKLRANIKALAKASEPGDLHIPSFAETVLGPEAVPTAPAPVEPVAPKRTNSRKPKAPAVDPAAIKDGTRTVTDWRKELADEADPAARNDILRMVARRTKSDADLSEVLDNLASRADDENSLNGYIVNAGNTAHDVEVSPHASVETKARASKIYEEIFKPESQAEPAPLITPEAEDLLRSADTGIPAFMSKRLKIIAHDNGIEVNENTTPQDVVAELRRRATEAEPVKASSGAAPDPVRSNSTPSTPFGETPEGIVAAPEPNERPTGLRKSLTTSDREEFGLNSLPSPERKAIREDYEKALKENLSENAETLAKIVNETDRLPNNEEAAGMLIRMRQLKTQRLAAINKLESLKDPTLIEEQERVIDDIKERYDSLTTAVRNSRTEVARRLNFSKLAIDDKYDIVTIKALAKAKRGGELSPEAVAKFEDLHKQLQEKDRLILNAETRLKESTAREAIAGNRRTKKLKPQEVHVRTAELASRARRLLRAGCHLS